MKYIIILLLSGVWLSHAHAQENYSQSFAIQSAQQLHLNLKYPELIQVSTYEGKEVKITGSVTINNGESNQAFELVATLSEGILTINEKTENYNSLPKRMMIQKGEAKYFFPTDNWNDPAVQKFLEDNGRNGGYSSTNGVIKEIKLYIKVPQSMSLNIQSDYGTIEIGEVKQSLTAVSKYGEVDISISETAKYNLSAAVKYGEIFTNLSIPFEPMTTADKKLAKWNDLYCKLNGGGPDIKLESKYSNVYIRKK